MQLEQSFIHFLLSHQYAKKRTLNFVILMQSIVSAARYIRHHYEIAGIQGNLGSAGSINVQGESVMAFDLMAHQIVMHYLRESGQVMEATSEEVSDEIRINPEGRYIVYFDPVDGSSNIKHNLPVGFLFGIAKRNLDAPEDYRLRKGHEFIAAGMFMIPTGIFTFALKDAGAYQFLLDSSGEFIRPTQIHLPSSKKSWELSWNSAQEHAFDKRIHSWIEKNRAEYNFRYAGSLAIDFHRLLHNGGLFLYPAIVNHHDRSKNRPSGKLRLMYEAAVVAFIAEQAGGDAINDKGESILTIMPEHRHQRTGLIVGSKELVSELRTALAK
jgi:fructose-1,6-bisphosphatase I